MNREQREELARTLDVIRRVAERDPLKLLTPEARMKHRHDVFNAHFHLKRLLNRLLDRFEPPTGDVSTINQSEPRS
jgi:hypothetical protein